MSITQIAERLGVHPNTARFHLDTLIDEGRVELAESEHKGRGRPAQMFRAVRQMDRGGTRRYRLLAEILASGIAADENPGAKALAAGRAWGQRLESLAHPEAATDSVDAEQAVDRLVEMCDELGFAPERTESAEEIQVGLRHCPFLELAEARPEVVCPIHLGLMQGALEAIGAPVAVRRLDAFAEPDLCLAHLAAVAPGRRPPTGGEIRIGRAAAGPARVEGVAG